MIERARLSARLVQLPRGMVGERTTNRYVHPVDGMRVFAQPGHISRDTKLVPIFDAPAKKERQ